MDAADHKLTGREDRFVREYLLEPNGTRAYLRAYATRQHTPTYHTARTEAARLLAKPCVAAAVAAGRRELRRRLRVDAGRVLRQLMAVAFADPVDAVEYDEESGRERVRPVRDMPADHRLAIKSMKRTVRRAAGGAEVETVEVRYADRLAALDKLARHLGLLRDGAALEELLVMLREERQAAAPPMSGWPAGEVLGLALRMVEGGPAGPPALPPARAATGP